MDPASVIQCFAVLIKGVGYYDINSLQKMKTILEAKNQIREFSEFLVWYNRMVNAWDPSSNQQVWCYKPQGFWNSVQSELFDNLKVGEMMAGICCPHTLFSVFDDVWVKESVIDLWSDILNKQQDVLEVVCVPCRIGETLNSLSGNRKRNDFFWLIKKLWNVATEYLSDDEYLGLLRIIIHKWIEQHQSTAPQIRVIIIPISYNQVHWVFLRIDLSLKIIFMTDSLKGKTWASMNWNQTAAMVFAYILVGLLSRHDYMKQFFRPRPQGEDVFDMQHESIYHQHNSSDCGVFVCVCMEATCKNMYHSLKLDNNWTYQQARLHVVGKCVADK